MKNSILKSIAALLLATQSLLQVYATEDANKTESPYFQVSNGEGLLLRHTEAEVNIVGVIADVTVRQVYINDGKNPMEAIYVFPSSTNAAVYGMKMKIGKRSITAQIHRKNEAREMYETASANGQTATLLEQERPNVFQMNVTNIMPKDTIVVELKYTELLVPTEGEYEFNYPTVVGPRYSSTPISNLTADEKWVGNPYQKNYELPTYTYDMKVHINTGVPIQSVYCTSHQVDFKYPQADRAELDLSGDEQYGGNRDFILKYRLTGDQIQSGVLVYEGEDENFFLAMVQPPKRVLPEHIPGREYIFIVDVSGSMSGFPLNTSKVLLRDLIGSLRPTDLFNVMLFAGGNSVMYPKSVPAKPKNIRKALNLIDNQDASGGTELLPALKRAIEMKETNGYSKSIVIATDGYVNVEKEAFDLIRNNLNKVNFFPFGIGTSVNHYLIEGMARVGQGEPFVVTEMNSAHKSATRFRKYIQSPVLTHIDVSYDGFSAYDNEPSLVPDVFAERPIIITGKFKGEPTGKIKVKGTSGNGQVYETELDLSSANNSRDNAALRYLWARNKIQALDDYAKASLATASVEEVTQLGLKYNLLTQYTSFIAIDDSIRNTGENAQKQVQTLPLPEGVLESMPGVSMQSLQCVTVSAGKYEQRVQDMVCAVQVISPMSSNSSGFYTAYLRGVEIRVEGGDWYSNYNWEAEAQRRAERKALRQWKKESKTVPDADSSIVSIKPHFLGGDDKIEEFLKLNLIYPVKEKLDHKEGIVYVSFIINADGTICFPKIEKGVTKAMNTEAVRLVNSMPRWTPGVVNGVYSRVRITIPIEFKLE